MNRFPWLVLNISPLLHSPLQTSAHPCLQFHLRPPVSVIYLTLHTNIPDRRADRRLFQLTSFQQAQLSSAGIGTRSGVAVILATLTISVLIILKNKIKRKNKEEKQKKREVKNKTQPGTKDVSFPLDHAHFLGRKSFKHYPDCTNRTLVRYI